MKHSSLHETIISFFLEHKRPPTTREIASHFQSGEAETRQALRALAVFGRSGAILIVSAERNCGKEPYLTKTLRTRK
ncbi:MAG TPA: hypothetical protein VF306_22260 [Pirellulales bacterium]